MTHGPLYKNMTVQVLTAITVGVAIGYFKPDWGIALQPLGDAFIKLVKMVVGPIIFLTIVCGIASIGDLKKIGRVGLKALIYFEVVTTLALAIGMIVANVVRPGDGVQRPKNDATVAIVDSGGSTRPSDPPATQAASPATAPTTRPSTQPVSEADAKLKEYAEIAKKQTTVEFLMGIIPDNILGAFVKGDLLQILFFSVLFGLAIASLGLKSTRLMSEMEHLTEVMFRIVGLIMKVAPLGALGAMAFTIGKFGIGSLLPLAKLMACVYATMAIFIFVILGLICRLARFSLWQYLNFIKEEILLVLGTSSSESALPRMIEKLELMGCSRGVVGMVVPAGYSFNLDGTSIYLSMAVLFISQAMQIPLSFGEQVGIMFILMLTSKGAAAVTGGGFVTLNATLAATHQNMLPGMTLLLGVDRFMSEARAITNLIGNGIATVVVCKWEGEFDQARYERAMSGQLDPLYVLPVEVTADLGSESSPLPYARSQTEVRTATSADLRSSR